MMPSTSTPADVLAMPVLKAFYRKPLGKFSPMTRTDLMRRTKLTHDQVVSGLRSLIYVQTSLVEAFGNTANGETVCYEPTPKGKRLVLQVIEAEERAKKSRPDVK